MDVKALFLKVLRWIKGIFDNVRKYFDFFMAHKDEFCCFFVKDLLSPKQEVRYENNDI